MTCPQPCYELVANQGFILRACVQVQCSNREMTPIPDVDSDMPYGHTTQTTTNSREQKKTNRVGFPFFTFYSPRGLQSETCY